MWDEETEEWYFSIIDVVGILTDSPNPNNYGKVLKNRLKKEGSELVTNCNQLKMPSADGKYYKTDVADTQLHIPLNSIHSVAQGRAFLNCGLFKYPKNDWIKCRIMNYRLNKP